MLSIIPTLLDALSGEDQDIFLVKRLWLTVTALREWYSCSTSQLTKTSQIRSPSNHRPWSFIMDEWIPIFTSRQAFSLEMANKPYIETLYDIPKDCDDQISEHSEGPDEDETCEGEITESDEDPNVVREFMRIGHESEGCLPQADEVVEFCQGCKDASLDAIRSGNGIPHFDPVASVIEQGVEGAREDSGPLGPVALYWRLKKAVSWLEVSQHHQVLSLTRIISASRTIHPIVPQALVYVRLGDKFSPMATNWQLHFVARLKMMILTPNNN
jgi:hypothetical protein